MREGILGVALVISFGAAPRTAVGQELGALRVGVHRSASAVPYTNQPQYNFATEATLTPRWPFVLGGAVIGGVAAGVWYAIAASKSGDPMINFAVPVIGIGTAAGAFAGWVVVESIRGAQQAPAQPND